MKFIKTLSSFDIQSGLYGVVIESNQRDSLIIFENGESLWLLNKHFKEVRYREDFIIKLLQHNRSKYTKLILYWDTLYNNWRNRKEIEDLIKN